MTASQSKCECSIILFCTAAVCTVSLLTCWSQESKLGRAAVVLVVLMHC